MSAYGQLLGINFNELKVLMGKSGKFDLSILYGRLKYQVNRTKLTPKGKREIARTREMVAAYNGKGLTATDEDLAALVGMGAIDCRAGMWMGNKLHSLAVEYLNQSCGLSWAGYKALYSQLYEFLRPSAPGLEEPIDEQAAKQRQKGARARGAAQAAADGGDVDRPVYGEQSPPRPAGSVLGDVLSNVRPA